MSVIGTPYLLYIQKVLGDKNGDIFPHTLNSITYKYNLLTHTRRLAQKDIEQTKRLFSLDMFLKVYLTFAF